MYYDVVEVEIIGELTLRIHFADGLSGTVRFLPSFLYGVFEPLKNPEFFKNLEITDGFISWSDELDLAPDSAYHAISQQSEWILS